MGEPSAAMASAPAMAAPAAPAAAPAAAAEGAREGAREGKAAKARAAKRAGGGEPSGNRKRAKTAAAKKTVPALGAYAKLEGKNVKSGEKIVEYVTQLPTTLGRTPTTEAGNFIGLGQGKDLDAEHAELNYDAKKREFTLRVSGASGALVAGRQYGGAKQEVAVLQNKDPIRIADACFYFLLPTSTKPIRPTLTYAELAEEAFARVGKGIPMSTREIAEVLKITYAYFQDAPGLTGSLQQAMRRSKSFMRVGVMKTDKSGPQRHAFLLSSDDSPLANERRDADDINEKSISPEAADQRIAELQRGAPAAPKAPPPAPKVSASSSAASSETPAAAAAAPVST